MRRWDTAAKLLPSAAADQGLEGLQVYPRYNLETAGLDLEERPYVGQVLLEASMALGEAGLSREPIRSSREVHLAAEAFREELKAAPRLAAISANLKRLMREYRRTERRVRALENVVLPEIRQDLVAMEEHLDLNEQEEVIRVRSLRDGG